MRNSSWLKLLIAIPSTIATLALVLAKSHLEGFHFNKEVRFGDVISVYSTALLAYVVQVSLTRRNKRDDATRALVMRHLDEFVNSVVAVKAPVASAITGAKLTPDQAQELIAVFEECQMQWSFLQVAVAESGSLTLQSACDALDVTVRDYKRRLTGASFPACTYTAAELETASFFRKDILIGCQKLRIELNKS